MGKYVFAEVIKVDIDSPRLLLPDLERPFYIVAQTGGIHCPDIFMVTECADVECPVFSPYGIHCLIRRPFPAPDLFQKRVIFQKPVKLLASVIPVSGHILYQKHCRAVFQAVSRIRGISCKDFLEFRPIVTSEGKSLFQRGFLPDTG